MRREFNDSQSREVVKKKRCEGKETGLNRVLSTATRLTGRIPRYAHVSEYMRDVLHCFSFPQRITYRVSALIWVCIEELTTQFPYLRELCCSILGVPWARYSPAICSNGSSCTQTWTCLVLMALRAIYATHRPT